MGMIPKKNLFQFKTSVTVTNSPVTISLTVCHVICYVILTTTVQIIVMKQDTAALVTLSTASKGLRCVV